MPPLVNQVIGAARGIGDRMNLEQVGSS
jgi:hypothetical protein